MLSVSRRELKFLMCCERAAELQAELDGMLDTDRYSKGGYYTVRSLYFDSFRDKDFSQKYDGMENRHGGVV